MNRPSLSDLRAALGNANAQLRESVQIAAATAARPSRPPRPTRKAASMRVVRRPKPFLVLVAEDDHATGRMYRDALSLAGAQVLLCPTLAEARDAIDAAASEAETPTIDVAVIDLIMPEDITGRPGSGASLVARLRIASPGTRIIVSTGLDEAAAHDDLRSHGVDPASVELIPKVAAHELRAVVGAR